MRNATLLNMLQPSYSPFDSFLKDMQHESAGNIFKETDESFLGFIDIPGISKNDLIIEVEDNMLKVSGERKHPFEAEKVIKKYNFLIHLPKNIDKEKIIAHFDNGVLKLELFKEVKNATKYKVPILTNEPLEQS